MRAMVLWMLALAGCSDILGAKDYRLEPPPPAVGPDQGTVFYDQQCTACLESACPAEVEACGANEACRELKRCVDDCRDPGCWLRCMQPRGYNFNANWPLAALDTCTFGPCEEACRVNEGNFDCVGKYGFPQFYGAGNTIDLKLTVGQVGQPNSSRYQGWTVTACRDAFCLDEIGTPQVSMDNGRLDYAVGTSQSGFTGYFEVTSDEQPDLTYVQNYDGPFNDFFTYDLLVDPIALSATIYQDEFGRPLPDDYGVAFFAINRDCHFFEPGGMTLELVPSEGVDVIYFFSDTASTSALPNPIGVAGPAGDYEMVLRDRTGRETRRLDVELSPQAYQVFVTLPSAR